MPDARFSQPPPPHHDWTDAFAALPLEAPGTSTWPAIAARLDAPRRARWPLWLATAAALALVAVVPLQRLADDGATPQFDGVVADTGAPAAAPSSLQGIAGTDAGLPTADGAVPTASATQAGNPLRAEFERLYAESAQLEAVLAMARDDRVASGPAAALSGELDAYLTSIDATLAQPALPRAQRLELWGRRVDALRQVAGFATTQRWLAASGDRYDGALVSIN
jgi:hypothetical protein